MKNKIFKAGIQSLAVASLFSVGCFEWCPMCAKDDQKFSPKPTYSLNKLEAPSGNANNAVISGAGAVSITENPLEGQAISVSNTPKATNSPAPIATSNPVTEITQTKFNQEKTSQKVHEIPAPKPPSGVPELPPASSGAPNLGIPTTSLAPGLSPIAETQGSDNSNKMKSPQMPNGNAPSSDSVMIPPPPGLPGVKPTPPTTILPPNGALPGTTPVGIPTPPGATPYR